jgi:UDP-3-O-[3-hydroxymyristoyl] glucosamine N-acyltransferase
MKLSLSVEDISRMTDPCRVVGSVNRAVDRIAALSEAEPGDLSFLANMKYRKDVAASRATVILVPHDFAGTPREGQVFLFQENPTLALARICTQIEHRLWPRPAPGVHATAVIGEGCRISPTATVGPFCVVEDGASVGDHSVLQAHVFIGRYVSVGRDCFLMAHVTIQGHCRLGDRVRLHSGVVIGGDGFGYDTNAAGRHEKLPQVGDVVLGDDVEIGANSTIDRARFDRTEVGEGTKIDNLVQLGHNVIIGKYCLIVALVGIAGSTRVGDHVVIGGQAGLGGHLTIGPGSMIAAKAGVNKSLPGKSYVAGAPALPILVNHKLTALKKRLPDLFRNVEQLEAAVKNLSSERKEP